MTTIIFPCRLEFMMKVEVHIHQDIRSCKPGGCWGSSMLQYSWCCGRLRARWRWTSTVCSRTAGRFDWLRNRMWYSAVICRYTCLRRLCICRWHVSSVRWASVCLFLVSQGGRVRCMSNLVRRFSRQIPLTSVEVCVGGQVLKRRWNIISNVWKKVKKICQLCRHNNSQNETESRDLDQLQCFDSKSSFSFLVMDH